MLAAFERLGFTGLLCERTPKLPGVLETNGPHFVTASSRFRSVRPPARNYESMASSELLIDFVPPGTRKIARVANFKRHQKRSWSSSEWKANFAHNATESEPGGFRSTTQR